MSTTSDAQARKAFQPTSLSGTSSVKSATRTIEIVEYVARAGVPPSAQAIGEALGIPASSLSYLLGDLVTREWLTVGERRTYTVGPGLRRIWDGPLTAAERIAPIVRQLRTQLNETCGYYEAVGSELIALLSELGHQALNFTMSVGERGPLHAFAAGKALLAFGARANRDEYLQRPLLQRFTEKTLINPRELAIDLRVTLQRGYALAAGEHTIGLISIAVPVGNSKLGAISVAVPAARYDQPLQEQILRLLRVAQEQLGAGPPPEPDDGETNG